MKPPPPTTDPLGPSPLQKTNLSSKSLQLNPQGQTLTIPPPPLSFYLQYSQPPSQRQSPQPYEVPSPQLLSLSNFSGLKLKYEDFMRRREDIRKKIAQICRVEDEKMKEKELRKLILTKPKMEEALVLQNMLRKAGSNIAFQKEILEIERDIELSNNYFQRLQGLWIRYGTELDDWKQPQNFGEIDDLLRFMWNDIYKLLIHDPILVEEFFRFGWFFQAKILLRSSRTDHQFPYIKFCEDLKKNALECQDETRKKSSLYQRIEKELQKHKGLVRKAEKYKQNLDNGMDIEKIDIEKIDSLLRDLKEFAFDVKEEVKFIEGILRKASQLQDLELLFKEQDFLEEADGSPIQKEETRESTLLEWEKDQEGEVRKIGLVESPICQIIETQQIPVIKSSFFKIVLDDKSCPRGPSCENSEPFQNYQRERLRKNLSIIKSSSPEIKKEQSSSHIEQCSPVKEHPFPVESLKTELQRKQEEKMRSLVSVARVLLSRKKKLPYKLVEEICSEYIEHCVMIPEAEEMYNIYHQEINRIQHYREELANKLSILTFEDLCMWSEKTRNIDSNLEGGYEEKKAELWLAKAKLIKDFSENLAEPVKPICLREICCIIVESDCYKDFFEGIKKTIFQDFVNFLKQLVEKVLKEVQRKLDTDEENQEIMLKDGIRNQFIEVNKELVREIHESRNIKKMAQKPKDVSSESLNQKRNIGEVKDSEIDLFNPIIKKQKREVETKGHLSICQKSQESELRDGKELLKRESDSSEILAGPEIGKVRVAKSDLNRDLVYLEKPYSDESDSGWKLKKKKKEDFVKKILK